MVFDGSDLYPELRNFMMTDVQQGNSYMFRVKAAYKNGFTDYSQESLPVWACSPPSGLLPVRQVAVTRSQMSFEWS